MSNSQSSCSLAEVFTQDSDYMATYQFSRARVQRLQECTCISEVYWACGSWQHTGHMTHPYRRLSDVVYVKYLSVLRSSFVLPTIGQAVDAVNRKALKTLAFWGWVNHAYWVNEWGSECCVCIEIFNCDFLQPSLFSCWPMLSELLMWWMVSRASPQCYPLYQEML